MAHSRKPMELRPLVNIVCAAVAAWMILIGLVLAVVLTPGVF